VALEPALISYGVSPLEFERHQRRLHRLNREERLVGERSSC
jgi:hypothetical protein